MGSAALRGLGLQREREAQEIYAQSQEIAEAESLEEEAREHRERAVAAGPYHDCLLLGIYLTITLGAHPAYRELGGGIKE